MTIVCPNCSTNFIISKEQIGIAGRKVKCSQCQHIWYLKLDFSNEKLGHYDQLSIVKSNNTEEQSNTNEKSNILIEEKEQNPIYAQGVNLPVLIPIKTPQYYYITPILWLSLIILLLLMLFHDKFNIPILYKEDNNMVTIDNIHIEQNKDIGKIKISYIISNNSDHNVVIPLIRVRLLDKNHQTVKSYIMNQKNTKLISNQQTNIITNLDIVPPTSKLVNIMLGNSLDFILQ